jgi:hypothetical protein
MGEKSMKLRHIKADIERAKRDPVEHDVIEYPFAAEANGFFNGDMFEDWLNDDTDDRYMELKTLIKQRDKAIKKQVRKELEAKLKDKL